MLSYLINFSLWYQLHIIVPSFCFVFVLACPVWHLSIRRLEKRINFVIFIQIYENTIYYFMS